MQANRRRDTKPELLVRRGLHAAGLRYRVDFPPVPGLRRRADIAFTKLKIAVFIDGCFWHGCPQHGPKKFGTNADYWVAKIETNRARDRGTTSALENEGWTVLRFWEHEEPESVVRTVAEVVKGPDRTGHPD
jgi:DNA mismatch endonuclease (patch repair protein)